MFYVDKMLWLHAIAPSTPYIGSRIFLDDEFIKILLILYHTGIRKE